MKELQILLAARLLTVTDGNYDKEASRTSLYNMQMLTSFQRRNIEILKIRFGEGPLQVCEVMLKDMTDSRRTDQHLQQQEAVVPSFRSPKMVGALKSNAKGDDLSGAGRFLSSYRFHYGS